MKKLLGSIILCIPLYVWGGDELVTPDGDNTLGTIKDTISHPISLFQPTAGDYILEGVSGFVVGIVGGYVGLCVAADNWDKGGTGVSLGSLFGVPVGVTLAAKLMGNKGSYWKSFLGTAVGLAGCIGLFMAADDMELPLIGAVGISLPIVGGVLGYHLGGHSHREE